MATFKRLTTTEGDMVYINLDLITMIERLPAEDASSYAPDGLPERTLIRFINGLDSERIVVTEFPHAIIG